MKVLENKTFVAATRSANQTRELGKAIGEQLEGGEVIILAGQLGAGKTTMAQGIALGLGITKPVSSPSFVLEKIYEGRLTLHHFDFYRLSRDEVVDSGLLTDLDPQSVTIIEWAQRGGDAVPQWTVNISIGFDFDTDLIGFSDLSGDSLDRRRISLESRTAKWANVLEYVLRGFKNDND